MSWFSHDHETAKAHSTVESAQPHEHKAKITHEVVSGAVAYEAAKAYEDHCKKNGKPASHEKAKEVLAGFTGVAADRIFETKGLDMFDKQKAKRDAEKHTKDKLSSGY